MSMLWKLLGKLLTLAILLALIAALLVFFDGCSRGPELKTWHVEKLDEEFTAEMADEEVRSFEAFLDLEQRLLAFRGERGLLTLPADWLLRMRFNPFYSYLEQRVTRWLEEPGALD
jgi:hypothetical protein